MERVPFTCTAVLITAVIACGTEPTPPGSLAITLDSLPSVSTATALTIAGTVVRTPPAPDVPITVSVAVASTTLTDSADADGRFTIATTLPSHQSTNITVTATDATGSTSTPVTVAVLHDATPPGVLSITPANVADAVITDAIVVQFSEPIADGSGTVTVSHQYATLAGSVDWSTDRTEVTFTPATPFPPNAIINVLITAVEDAAGNTASASPSCFITGGAASSPTDPTGDLFVSGSPGPTLVPIDITQLRFAQSATTFYSMLRFTTPRSMSATSPSNIFAVLDIDIDSDPGTGFPSAKDIVFSGVLPSSGMGAEYAIVLIPQQSLADTSIVIQYADTLEGPITAGFLPTTCGSFLGFAIPRTALGSDEGSFRAVLLALTGDETGDYVDAAPDAGAYAVALPAAAPPALSASTGAPEPLGPVRRVPRMRETWFRRQ
jgi:hypothetical protein